MRGDGPQLAVCGAIGEDGRPHGLAPGIGFGVEAKDGSGGEGAVGEKVGRGCGG